MDSLTLEEEKEKKARTVMRTQHNGTWKRLFISKLCRMRPVWAPSSLKKGQFEGPHFTEQIMEERGGLEGKGHPEPWLNHIEVPTTNSRTRKALILAEREEFPLPLGLEWCSGEPWCLCVHSQTQKCAGSLPNVHEQPWPRAAYQQGSHEKMIKANIITPACLMAG